MKLGGKVRWSALGAAMSLALCAGLLPTTALASESQPEETLAAGQARQLFDEDGTLSAGVAMYAPETVPVEFGGESSCGWVKGFLDGARFTFTVPEDGEVEIYCWWVYKERPFNVAIKNAAGQTLFSDLLSPLFYGSAANGRWSYVDVLPKGDYQVDVNITGHETYLGEAFHVQVGWAEDSSNSSSDSNAGQSSGWVQSGSKWWYRNADGTYPASCWKQIDGSWYLFDGSGYMRTGWAQVGGSWYYLKGSGAMATGWQQVGNTWYWMGFDGAMRTGWYTVDGEWNWSDSSGAWHANSWVSDSNGWWYSWADGTYPTSSWQLIGGKWYHFNSSGYMQTGWLSDGGTWYYLANSGAMVTGWAFVGGDWYYLDANRGGAMDTGWYQVGGVWYYSNSSGAMQANCWIDGKYWLTGSGAMATNAWVDGGRYYVGSNGAWIPNYSDTPSQQDPVKDNNGGSKDDPAQGSNGSNDDPTQGGNNDPVQDDSAAQEDNSIVGDWVIRAVRTSSSGGLVPANDESILFIGLDNGGAGLRFIREDSNYFGTWSFRDYTDDGEPMFLVEFENGSKWIGEVYEENGVDQLILMSMNDSDYVLLFSLYSRE